MSIKVYVAGPYSKGDIEANVNMAIDSANRLMDYGFIVFNPLLSHFHEVRHSRPYEDWMSQDMAFLPQCNAVLRNPGESPGADRETALARSLNIPVFTSVEELDEHFSFSGDA